MSDVLVVGGGLAGCEAAWQLADAGLSVTLCEMRPLLTTGAHTTDCLAEVVCSNSFGSESETTAPGILKTELALAGSLLLTCAQEVRVPAGGALAVDRDLFAALVTERISSHPRISVRREEVTDVPSCPAILATGPLTSPTLARILRERLGDEGVAFFDAVAPIVTRESIDMSRAYVAGRYGRGNDYINCPLDEEEYQVFYETLKEAERVTPHDFEGGASCFEGCMPIEVLAERGLDTLRFGPMKPVGLPDPRTGREPHAVVQLRQDNREGTLYNLVGFQTGLRWPAQARLIRTIPGLESAEVVRYGVMHRNTSVNAPAVLDPHLRPRALKRPDLFLAGQVTGVEGYMESTAMGLVAGLGLAAVLDGREPPVWPRETAIGSLLHYLQSADPATFQPMNVNLGLFPPLERRVRDRKKRAAAHATRAERVLRSFLGLPDLQTSHMP
ncbi:MAG: methylenetetrahydrofolate--tRNA-(uracil(54)-C(5))-methyltransferase (FADH(2)-oxidizing) TrmFO [Fretibacterium sp.]|nr:methylenetetrahydrofolate--tRNA-(uracil(54)-C(5))-methyltransferase (FADH(2)-oxidizing) TrmFO [Fretibacterium sp.]